MKKILYHIREFFWPLIDSLTPEEKKKRQSPLVIPEVAVAEENVLEAYTLSATVYKDEEERRKGVESKAALLLSTISIASSIIVTASAYIAGTENVGTGTRISICVSALVAIYAARTVWFSVRALERGNYHQLGINEINIPGSKNHYLKSLTKKYWEASLKNGPVVDKKVEFLVLAQEYYKRAIIVIFIYAIVVLATSLLPNSFLGKKTPSHVVFKVNVPEILKIEKTDTVNCTLTPAKKLPDSIPVKKQY